MGWSKFTWNVKMQAGKIRNINVTQRLRREKNVASKSLSLYKIIETSHFCLYCTCGNEGMRNHFALSSIICADDGNLVHMVHTCSRNMMYVQFTELHGFTAETRFCSYVSMFPDMYCETRPVGSRQHSFHGAWERCPYIYLNQFLQ